MTPSLCSVVGYNPPWNKMLSGTASEQLIESFQKHFADFPCRYTGCYFQVCDMQPHSQLNSL